VLFVTQACPLEDVPGTVEGNGALGAGLHASHYVGLAPQGQGARSCEYKMEVIEL
jgi:hypothetical protein